MTSGGRGGSCEDWDDARKLTLVTQIVNAELSVEEACARHGLSGEVIHDWLRLFRRSALLVFDERLKRSLIDQGANAEALTGAEFTGTVHDISIADLLQIIHMGNKDATIMVTSEGVASRIWCTGGAIVDAESGRLTGEAAVYRILGLDHGRVVADLRSTPRVRAIHAPVHQLLLGAAHRKDESGRLLLALGGEQRLYRLTPRAAAKPASMRPAELSLLRSIHGACSVEEICRQSELGDLETLTTLKRLIDAEYVTAARATAPPPPPRRVAPSVAGVERRSNSQSDVQQPASVVPLAVTKPPARVSVRRWVWAAAGVALLPLALWLPLEREAAPPPAAPRAVASPLRPTEASPTLDARIAPPHAELDLPPPSPAAPGERRTLEARPESSGQRAPAPKRPALGAPMGATALRAPAGAPPRPAPQAVSSPPAAAPRVAPVHDAPPDSVASALPAPPVTPSQPKRRTPKVRVIAADGPKVRVIGSDSPNIQVIDIDAPNVEVVE